MVRLDASVFNLVNKTKNIVDTAGRRSVASRP